MVRMMIKGQEHRNTPFEALKLFLEWCDEQPYVMLGDIIPPKLPLCHADRDGDCTWKGCPQLRDNEPAATGRHCPIDRCSVCLERRCYEAEDCKGPVVWPLVWQGDNS